LPRLVSCLILSLCILVSPLANAQVSRRAPDYSVKLTTGKQIPLSSYRGKVVALLFVSTDCPHCQDTCRYMEMVQRQYGSRGLQTLAVAFNPMAIMLVKEFASKSGATFPVGYEERDPVFAFLQRSTSLQTYVPIMVLIDRNGVIRGQHLGDDPIFKLDPTTREMLQVRTAIDRLLAEPPGAAKKTAAPTQNK
jgi:peroxiredoxin